MAAWHVIPLRYGAVVLPVTLEERADDVIARVDDRTYAVRVLERSEPTWLATGAGVERMTLVVDGRVQQATVARSGKTILVALDGHVVRFELADDATERAGASHGSGTVVAPMPGKVVAVLVAVGDTVEAGQPLVVLEAMKMETTLAAEIPGTVTTLAARPGATVDGGAILVEIAPPAA